MALEGVKSAADGKEEAGEIPADAKANGADRGSKQVRGCVKTQSHTQLLYEMLYN